MRRKVLAKYVCLSVHPKCVYVSARLHVVGTSHKRLRERGDVALLSEGGWWRVHPVAGRGARGVQWGAALCLLSDGRRVVFFPLSRSEPPPPLVLLFVERSIKESRHLSHCQRLGLALYSPHTHT